MAHDRPTSEESHHDQMVCVGAEHLKDDGYDVAADAECDVYEAEDIPTFSNYPSGCGDESTRKPDVYGTKGNTDRIMEVETSSSISDERTKCQLSTFANEGDAIVAVPEEDAETMRDNLDNWGLKKDVSLWTYG